MLPILVWAVGVRDAIPLFMVAYRHTTRGRNARIRLRGFLNLGAASSFLSAMVGSVGPIMAPFFLAYGLVRGA